MMYKRTILPQRLLITALVLLILLMALMPLSVSATYSTTSSSPTHTLTYSKNRLRWDKATGIREDGTAELNLFSTGYDGTVRSANGDAVVAPGTAQDEFVRLKNSVEGKITYTAVLYEIKTDQRLDVVAHLTGEGFEDTERYSLPKGVREDQVVRAVRGTLKGGRYQDFGIDWSWSFTDGEERDVIDTELGNKQELDEVTLGLYIVVEDDNIYAPEQPKTGDDFPVAFYLGGMGVCLFLLLVLLRRRDDEDDEKKCDDC